MYGLEYGWRTAQIGVGEGIAISVFAGLGLLVLWLIYATTVARRTDGSPQAESATDSVVTKETIIASPCRVVANVQELKIESTGWPRFRVTLDGIEQSHIAELALSMKPGRLPEVKLTRLLRRSNEAPSVPGEVEKPVRHYD